MGVPRLDVCRYERAAPHAPVPPQRARSQRNRRRESLRRA